MLTLPISTGYQGGHNTLAGKRQTHIHTHSMEVQVDLMPSRFLFALFFLAE